MNLRRGRLFGGPRPGDRCPRDPRLYVDSVQWRDEAIGPCQLVVTWAERGMLSVSFGFRPAAPPARWDTLGGMDPL